MYDHTERTTADQVLLIRDLATLLKTSEQSIRRRLRAGVFPIPALRGVDMKWRWSRAAVERYLAGQPDLGGRSDAPAPPRPPRP